MKIYVTGASGKLGQAVMKLLPDATPVSLRDPSTNLFSFFKDADVVIHLAGSLKFNDKEELWNVNHLLTRTVARATPKTARLIHASSVSVYGKKLAELPATETTQCQPDTEYAKSKLAGEKEVLKHPNAVALRIAAIYGPQFDDYFKMLTVLKKNGMFFIGDGSNHVPFVHVDDVAQAIVQAIKAPSGIYLVAGPPITQRQIYEVACRELNVQMPRRSIPPFLAPVFLGIYNGIRKIQGKGAFLTEEHINILSNDRIFDCTNAKKFLKFKPRSTPMGIKELAHVFNSR